MQNKDNTVKEDIEIHIRLYNDKFDLISFKIIAFPSSLIYSLKSIPNYSVDDLITICVNFIKKKCNKKKKKKYFNETLFRSGLYNIFSHIVYRAKTGVWIYAPYKYDHSTANKNFYPCTIIDNKELHVKYEFGTHAVHVDHLLEILEEI